MVMKHLKLLISLGLLFLAIPVWRLLDMATWLNMDRYYITLSLLVWSSLFLVVPFSLIYRRFFIPGNILNVCFAILVQLFSGVYSSHSMDLPEARHCSLLNFSGFFYTFKNKLPAAHNDDLMIRNQICWLRKLEKSIPQKLTKHETRVYQELVEKKLSLPEIKWKNNLPFIIAIYQHFTDQNMFIIEGQKFWATRYKDEVNQREYNFLSFPHSSYIKWEYELVERYLTSIWSEPGNSVKYVAK